MDDADGLSVGGRSPPREDRDRGYDDRAGGGGGGGGGGGSGKEAGVALRWNERGFGFIKPDAGGDDLFCHLSQIQDGNALREGAKVEFVNVFDERRGLTPAPKRRRVVVSVSRRLKSLNLKSRRRDSD